MEGDYPNDWSEEDIAAAESGIPSWESSNASLKEDDVKTLERVVGKLDEHIGVPDSIEVEL